ERLLALANAFRSDGLAAQAIQLARRALAQGAPADARTYRLLYPGMLEQALLAEAREHGLDAGFVAALIRQESMFNPAATSPVGARGLMQVMPDLGSRLAQSLAYPVWDPVLLYQPDVSLELGAYQLLEVVGAELEAHVRLVEQHGVPDRIGQRLREPAAQIRHHLHQAARADRRGGGGIEHRLLPDQRRDEAGVEPVLARFGEQRLFQHHGIEQAVGARVRRRALRQRPAGELDRLSGESVAAESVGEREEPLGGGVALPDQAVGLPAGLGRE